MKKIIPIVIMASIVVIIIVFLVTTISSGTPVSHCSHLTSANTVYYLDSNITHNESEQFCITIDAENITFDLRGFTMNGTRTGNYGGIYSVYNNTIIRNGYIKEFADGIRFWYSFNSSIQNVSIYNDSDDGIDIYQGGYHTINNTVVQLVDDEGIIIYGNATGVEMENVVFNGSGGNEIRLQGVTNIVMRSVEATDSIQGNANATFLEDFSPDYSINIKGINFTSDGIGIQSNASYLNGWFYRLYVNDTDGLPVENANVTIMNSTGSIIYNLLTNSSGFIPRIDLLEYFENFTSGKIYRTPHIINISAPDHNNQTVSYNVTSYENNLFHNIELTSGDIVVPTVGALSENPSDPATYSSSNIYEFNATIADTTLNTVLLEFDGVNYTATNTSGNGGMFNVTFPELAVGSYSYRWYANDSENNVNNSETGEYTINQGTPSINLTLNGVQGNVSIIRGQSIPLSCSLTEGDSISYLTTYKNDTLINNGTSPISNTTTFSDLGQFNISCYYGSTENYTGTSQSWNVNVSKEFIENSQTFNATTYESSSETFILNITYNSTRFASSSAVLYYNGTGYIGTRDASGGDTVLFSRNLNIGLENQLENKTFYWEINLSDGSDNLFNSSFNNQTVYQIQFDLCNTTLSTIFLDILFKNETLSQEDINSTIDLSATYWLNNQDINRTVLYTNTTENLNYTFCFNPGYDTMNTKLFADYYNSESQQRTYSASLVLTNSTTSKTLYLLPISEGLFSPFQTVDNNGGSISSVLATITRTLGGSTILITSDYTDDSGYVTFFLDPDVSYSATFSKTGYSDNTFTFVPTSEIRNVPMGGGSGSISNGTQISSNTSWIITPENSSLNNNTIYTFGFNVLSTQSITFISMNITNSSGGSIGYVTGSGIGYISITNTTGNLTKIVGKYIIQTSDETFSLSKLWIVGEEYEGDYSLYRQLRFFDNYGFSDFIRLLIVILVLVAVVIYMSASETIETSESKVMVIVLIIWGFSILGWLDTGLASSSTGTNLDKITQFSSKYGIAILSSIGASFFILRRLFTTRI